MTEFVSKKIEKGFGEILRTQRKSLGYNLKQISQILNIKEVYLKALEEENLDELPPQVYVQGFLKHYSRFLGLEEKVVLRAYKMERDIRETLKAKRGREKLVYPQRHLPHNPFLALSPRTLKLGLVILAVIIFFIYLGWEISGFSAAPSLSILSPQDNKKINTDSVTVIGKSDKGAEVFINGQKVFVDPEGNFTEQVILSEGLNNIEILAKNKLGREHKEERKILVNLPPDYHSRVEGVDMQKPEGSGELSLIVQIKNSATWISIDTDGVNVFQGTMLPDTSQEFRAKDKITLTSGKAGNTYVVFNGKDLGNLGKEGEVVRDVEFTRGLEIQKKENR